MEEYAQKPGGLARIGLGGGCHWCTEAVFASLRGVIRTQQGWIASEGADAEFSEAVIVHYDPALISAADLIGVHLETHSATADHPLRGRYRSAVYYFDPAEAESLQEILRGLAGEYERPLQTRILPYVKFKSSLPEHLNYYYSEPERPFCRRYIAPKLRALRLSRPALVNNEVGELTN